VIDWLLGLVATVIGLALIAVGAGLYTRVDRALIADAVTGEGAQLEGLTPAEAVTAAEPLVDWLALGVGTTGLGLVTGAVAFVVARRRTRRRVAREGGTTATFLACAVYGAAVSALVSVLPGSTVAGGAAASYLYDGDAGVRIGAAAGLVGIVLTVPLLVCFLVGLLAGASALGRLAGGAVLAGIVAGGELLALVLSVGLGALGGVLVSRFR
jgi:ascorbate-specific PTS system EIIC-type component UlaA